MKISLKNRLLLSLWCLVFAAGLTTRPVHGQNVSLSIWPPILEIMIQPGKEFTQAYEISNQSGVDLYLKAKVVPFHPNDLEGGIVLDLEQPAERYFSLTNGNIFLNQTFRLPANSRQQLVLKIAVPKDEPEGDHYFTFLIEQSAEGKFAGDAGGRASIKLGSNILLTVSQSGLPAKQALIVKFQPRPKIADLLQKVRLEVLIENIGPSFFKTIGKIEISHRLFKKRTAELELRPDNVLVNSRRRITCQNDCSFASLLPGPYQAKLSFSPDGTGEKQEAVTGFWILPVRSGLVITTLLLIIFLIKFNLKRDLTNRSKVIRLS